MISFCGPRCCIAVFAWFGLLLIRHQTEACMGSPADRGQAIINYLGGNTILTPLPDHRKGANICDAQDTMCDFAESFSCRWGDDQKTDNHWFRAEGNPDPTSWAAATGRQDFADEPYAIVPVIAGQNSDNLLSDPFQYQHDSEAIVVFDYWMTAGAQIKVCALSADTSHTPLFCSTPITQSSSPPGQAMVSIQGPINRPFQLAIIPQSASGTPGFIAIDNLAYSGTDICPVATTTTQPTTTTAPSLPGMFGCDGPFTPWPDHRQQQPVHTLPDDLQCQPDPNNEDPSVFPCRWGSDGDHYQQWQLVECQPDPNIWQSETGTSVVPSGPFLAEQLDGKTKPDWLMSDPVKCLRDDSGTVSFMYWTTATTSLEVCAVDQDRIIIPGTCSHAYTQSDSPGPVTTKVPGPIAQPFSIAFIPSGKSGFVAVQNVQFSASPCEDITTTTPTPDNGGSACTTLVCSFDSGPCTFNPNGAGATRPLITTDGKNPPLGCAENGKVRPDAQTGVSFLGQNVSYGDIVVLESPEITVNRPITLSMRIFSTMYGGQVSVCTGQSGSSFSGCQVVTGTDDFSLANLYWMTKTATLAPGTRKIYIVGQMVYRQNVCNGLAIDNLSIVSGC